MDRGLDAAADNTMQWGKPAQFSMWPLRSFFAIKEEENFQQKEMGGEASVKQTTRIIHKGTSHLLDWKLLLCAFVAS